MWLSVYWPQEVIGRALCFVLFSIQQIADVSLFPHDLALCPFSFLKEIFGANRGVFAI